ENKVFAKARELGADWQRALTDLQKSVTRQGQVIDSKRYKQGLRAFESFMGLTEAGLLDNIPKAHRLGVLEAMNKGLVGGDTAGTGMITLSLLAPPEIRKDVLSSLDKVRNRESKPYLYAMIMREMPSLNNVSSGRMLLKRLAQATEQIQQGEFRT